jgi:hypothetical protein
MSNTYTWSFPTLTAYPTYESQTDVVFIVHWVLNGTDGNGHNGSVYGTVSLTYTAGTPFTPFAQLTESQVQGWVTSALGATQVSALEANIDQQIQQQIAPTSVNLTPPWGA